MHSGNREVHPLHVTVLNVIQISGIFLQIHSYVPNVERNANSDPIVVKGFVRIVIDTVVTNGKKSTKKA